MFGMSFEVTSPETSLSTRNVWNHEPHKSHNLDKESRYNSKILLGRALVEGLPGHTLRLEWEWQTGGPWQSRGWGWGKWGRCWKTLEKKSNIALDILPCKGKPLPAEQVDKVIVRTPQKGEAGQGEGAAQREQEGELSGVEHEQGEEGHCQSKADHAQNQTGHESNDSLLLGQAWQPLICLSGKPALRPPTATASIINLKDKIL